MLPPRPAPHATGAGRAPLCRSGLYSRWVRCYTLPVVPTILPGVILPPDARRIVVAGGSGAGKTTLARQLGVALDLPYVEMDGLFHGPGWTPRPEFEAEVESFIGQDAWVTEWQYSLVRARLAQRADTMIWLDYARPVVMQRVIIRTVVRWLLRQELWNGNYEPSLVTAFTHPTEGIVRWAWDTHDRARRQVGEYTAGAPHLRIVRLRRPRDARQLLSFVGFRPVTS